MKLDKELKRHIIYGVSIILIITLLTGLFIYFNGSSNPNDIVVLETNKGDIRIELYLEQAPITAGNFRDLVQEGFYDGTRFHRVIDEFMIQGGDPKSKDTSLFNEWGTGGPGYTIEDEFVENLSNLRGTISMANVGRPNTGGSQFFINTVDNIFLDYDKEPLTSRHSVFGKVIYGMDVVDEIESTNTIPGSNRPQEDIIIERAYVE